MKDFWNQTLGWTKDWKNRECLDTRLGYLFSIGGPAATGLLTLFPHEKLVYGDLSLSEMMLYSIHRQSAVIF
jgi:hypothetical protein